MTPPAAFDNTFALLAHDLLIANERDGLTPADSARYDAASTAFDALLRHVYPGLSPRAADRLSEQVVHYGVKASVAARVLQD
jgi:hypothetical protein